MADPFLAVVRGGASNGPSTNSGTPQPLTSGHQNDLQVSQLHGRGYEMALRRASFHAANQAGVTTTVGLATTYTGLCLSNPNGSGKNLEVGLVGVTALVAFAAAAAVGIMVGFSTTDVTHTTPGTPRNNFIDTNFGTAGVGKIDTAATLPVAPVVHTIFGAGLTGAITTIPGQVPQIVDMQGCLVIPPGGYMAIYTSTASGASGILASIQWNEVPAA